MLCLSLGLTLLGELSGAFASQPDAPRRVAMRVYVVRPGDTLWAIAVRQAGPTEDPRPLVDALVRLNHLRDALITPGQRLILSS